MNILRDWAAFELLFFQSDSTRALTLPVDNDERIFRFFLLAQTHAGAMLTWFFSIFFCLVQKHKTEILIQIQSEYLNTVVCHYWFSVVSLIEIYHFCCCCALKMAWKGHRLKRDKSQQSVTKAKDRFSFSGDNFVRKERRKSILMHAIIIVVYLLSNLFNWPSSGQVWRHRELLFFGGKLKRMESFIRGKIIQSRARQPKCYSIFHRSFVLYFLWLI